LRRSPSNWTQTDSRTSFLFSRGYTMHEHLDGFGLINMNGRVYDPIMAQFLSPDPFIQAPGNWYNYNRYGYCYNNPLIYNDPSGEIIGFLLAIWAGNYLINSVAYAINNNTSLKTAFKATPIVGGVGFSPTGFVTGQSNMGFSHPQLDAHLAVKNEMRVSKELDTFIAATNGGGSFGGFSEWWDKHFTAQLDGEITYGVQIAAGLKKGLDFNANIISQVILESGWGNSDKYFNSYEVKPFSVAAKVKALDFGGSYYGGGNYNWNVENGNRVSQTISAGGFGGLISGTYTWGKGGSSLFLGIDVGGKFAIGWGASGSAKFGFTWEW